MTKRPNISYEFFPPKNEVMEARLWASIRKLETLSPEFVSVTYGAGGSTRDPTQKAVTRIANETSLNAAAHLTCVGARRSEVDQIARDYWDAGVRHIVALRGDPADGIGSKYVPYGEGYAYGSDLVAGLKRIAEFEISVSAYPEKHPESGTWDAEIDNLKRKVDAGASRAITQFFIEPETFLRFQDRVLAAGIDIPIVPGIMLQPNFRGLNRMAGMCGVEIPEWYANLFEGLENDPETRQVLTASIVSELIADLQQRGVEHFHFYTLNRAELAYAATRVLGLQARGKAA